MHGSKLRLADQQRAFPFTETDDGPPRPGGIAGNRIKDRGAHSQSLVDPIIDAQRQRRHREDRRSVESRLRKIRAKAVRGVKEQRPRYMPSNSELRS